MEKKGRGGSVITNHGQRGVEVGDVEVAGIMKVSVDKRRISGAKVRKYEDACERGPRMRSAIFTFRRMTRAFTVRYDWQKKTIRVRNMVYTDLGELGSYHRRH